MTWLWLPGWGVDGNLHATPSTMTLDRKVKALFGLRVRRDKVITSRTFDVDDPQSCVECAGRLELAEQGHLR